MSSKTATATIDYEPQEKQSRFHACPADEVFYGGAAGGGKSYALLYDAYITCLKYAGIDAVLFRRTFPQLEMYHINIARKEWPQSTGSYNASKYIWTFKNGSRLMFRALKQAGDETEYQSAEFAWIGFDELTHFLEDQYTYLISRNRSTKLPRGVKPQVKSASNPGNIGHGWVKRRFVDPAPPNTIFERSREAGAHIAKTSRCFIPAKIWDNPILMKSDPTYLGKLQNMRETERKKLLEGDWDIIEGAAFAEWDSEIHVIKPFAIPASWRVEMAMDWGYQKPFWMGWFAWDHDDRPYLIREWYGCRMEEFDDPRGADKGIQLDAYDVGRGVLGKEGSTWRVRRRIAPSDIWDQRGHGSSIATDLMRAGLNGLMRANRDRELGALRLHEYLKLDDHGEPFFRVFETCRGFIRTVPLLQIDEKNPEDVDTESEDHPYDGARYMLMAHAMPVSASGEFRGRRPPDYQARLRRRKRMRRSPVPAWKVA